MIHPTVGRKVWYRPSAYDTSGPGGMQAWGEQPCDATVIYVHGDGSLINAHIIDHNGHAHARTSVRLLRDGEAPPEGQSYCEWMPYQKSQHTKQETPAA